MQCDKCGNVTIHANDLTKNIGTIRASPTPRHTHTVTLHSTIQCQWLYTALLSVYTQCIEIKHTHTHTRVSDSAQHNTVYTQIKHVCQWLYTVSIHSVFKQNTHTNTCQWLDLHNSTQCLYTNKTHTYVSVSTQTNTRMWRYVSVSTHTHVRQRLPGVCTQEADVTSHVTTARTQGHSISSSGCALFGFFTSRRRL